MPGSVITIDSRKFKALLARTPGALAVGKETGLNLLGVGATTELVRTRTRGRPGVQTRTGLLRRGIGHEVGKDDLASWVSSFVAGVKYANLQEFGGTIVPKRAKWLTIPVGPALNPSGVARGSARSFPDLQFKLVNPRLALLVKKITSKNLRGDKLQAAITGIESGTIVGQLIHTVEDATASKNSKRHTNSSNLGGANFKRVVKLEREVVYFVLKKKVVIPPRLGFVPTWKAYVTENAVRVMEKGIRLAVKKLNEGGAK